MFLIRYPGCLAVAALALLLLAEPANAQYSASLGGASAADRSTARSSNRTPSMSSSALDDRQISRARMRKRPPAGSLSLGGSTGMQDNPHFAKLPTAPSTARRTTRRPPSPVDTAQARIRDREREMRTARAQRQVRSFRIGRVGSGGTALAD